MQSFLEEDYFPLPPSPLLRYYPWILICPLVVPSFETFISCYNYSPIHQSVNPGPELLLAMWGVREQIKIKQGNIRYLNAPLFI